MRWKAKLLAVTVVLLVVPVAICLLVVLHRSNGSVAIGFRSYKDGVASFTLTNLNSFPIQYMIAVERKTTDGWPDYTGHVLPHMRPVPPENYELGPHMFPVVRPLHSSVFSIPVKYEVPARHWRVSVAYVREFDKLDGLTEQACDFCDDHNMPWLDRLLWVGGGWSLASGSEMQQEQNASNKPLQPTAVDPDTFTLK